MRREVERKQREIRIITKNNNTRVANEKKTLTHTSRCCTKTRACVFKESIFRGDRQAMKGDIFTFIHR